MFSSQSPNLFYIITQLKKKLSFANLLYSVAGMTIFSLAVAWMHPTIPVHDKMLAAIFAGIVSGAGGGVILKSLGSAGGMDILSIILLKRFSIRLGTSILVLNGLILTFAAYVFSLQDALYTLIFLFVSTQVLNVVVYGLSQAFVVVSDTLEVMGNGIGNQPHW